MKGLAGPSASQFQRVHMNDIPVAEEMLTLNLLPNDFYFVKPNIIGELARRSLQKDESTVRQLRCNNHVCFVSNKNAVLQFSRAPNFDTFLYQSTQFGATFKCLQ